MSMTSGYSQPDKKESMRSYLPLSGVVNSLNVVKEMNSGYDLLVIPLKTGGLEIRRRVLFPDDTDECKKVAEISRFERGELQLRIELEE